MKTSLARGENLDVSTMGTVLGTFLLTHFYSFRQTAHRRSLPLMDLPTLKMMGAGSRPWVGKWPSTLPIGVKTRLTRRLILLNA